MSANAKAATPPEHASESELCPLARKVPKVKSSGDHQKYKDQLLERSQMARIIDMLTKNPPYIATTWSWLQDHNDRQNANGHNPGRELWWPESYTFVSKLPKYWQAEFLAAMSDNELSLQDLEALDAHDNDAVGNLFRMAVQVQKGDALPRQALEKRVCYRLFEERYQLLGKRLIGWKKRAVLANNTVDWLKGGVFAPVIVGGKVCQVRHISGDHVEVPEYLAITASFTIGTAWDDCEATFKHGIAAQRLKAELDDQMLQQNRGAVAVVGEDFGKQKTEMKRKAALEKARAAVKRQKLEKAATAGASLAHLVPPSRASASGGRIASHMPIICSHIQSNSRVHGTGGVASRCGPSDLARSALA